MNKPDFEPELSKNDIIAFCNIKHIRLAQRQREYKKILLAKTQTRKQTLLSAGYKNGIKLLRLEKNDLKAQIWTANAVIYQEQNRRYLSEIKCHVHCQEHLEEQIQQLKVDSRNMEQEIGRLHKQIYNLNRKTIPDTQYLDFVIRTRKRLSILANLLEVKMHRECGITADNEKLRNEIVTLLNQRTWFNTEYSKLVHSLTSDHKYITDLIEYAVDQFDNCIAVYDKMNYILKRQRKENELRKLELQGLIRTSFAQEEQNEFLYTKNKERVLADLQPKEYRRRQKFREEHLKNINLYHRIMNKIMEYTKSHNEHSVIIKFKEQEHLYYSYFNFANEMSYHIALLNNSVDRLFTDIKNLSNTNEDRKKEQLDTIENLTEALKVKQLENKELQTRSAENDTRLENLLQGVEEIFEMANADATPLKALLGDHSHIDLVNVDRFCKILEMRICDVIACVFITERQADKHHKTEEVVRDNMKIYEPLTDLADIVLTQQCPECAEGDAYEDAAEGGPKLISLHEAKFNLYEKVNQPEMQYRLHSLSHCRLPRSRQLTAKRNG